MKHFQCDRCLYTTTKKINYITHINRKKVCKSAEGNNNIDIYQLYHKYNIPFNNDNISPLWKEYTKTKDIQIVNGSENIICDLCSAIFTRHTSLKRHQRDCINQSKLLNELEENKKELIEIKEKLNKLDLVNNTIINNTNNISNTNTNNNNNIVVNNYGEEDISYITNDQLKQYALNIPDGINQLAETSHFSPQHPENKNIRIDNKNDKQIQIWKDNKWIYKNRNKLIDNIIFAKYAILGGILAEMEINNEISQFKLELLEKIKDKYVDDDLFFEQIQKNIDLMILNNSNL